MMTTPPAPVTITLAVPTPFAVDPARLVAWLTDKGYSADPAKDSGLWLHYARDGRAVAVPLRPEYSDYPRCLRDAVRDAALAEGLDPAALAVLLAPPVEGPALQWAHMAEPAKARILALLDGPATEHRCFATLARSLGDADKALHHEGRALEYEAAAAVLREGGRE